MGQFKTRREAMQDAKSNLFCDWFLLVSYDDGTWDYAAPGRHLPASDRKQQIMYQRSRATDRWYIATA